MKENACLTLEDGTIFTGTAIGLHGTTFGEVVFNTSMTGYQEILTDPSYKNQIITFTYPNIGNTGINNYDIESNHIQIQGIIIKNLSLIYSNYQSKISLEQYLKNNNIVGIADIDTRKLTRILRTKGNQYGCISSPSKIILDNTFENIKKKMNHKNNDIKYKKNKTYNWNLNNEDTYSKSLKIKKPIFHVVVYDFGVKKNILRILINYGCYLTIIPLNTEYKKILLLNPDGILLSNGPGDPRSYNKPLENVKKLLKKKIPIFGICLGHQILALANNAKIIKMKFGHHGSNHPVKNLKTKKVMITTQNHNFTIDKKNLPKNIQITHQSLFDNTIQGIKIIDTNFFGFQGHPESSPGPQDSKILFQKFIKNIINYKRNLHRN